MVTPATKICFNSVRIVMIEGLIILCWRELTPAVFDYTASCDSDGRITNKALREATRKRHKHDVGKSVREL